jgi:hypothetical protein
LCECHFNEKNCSTNTNENTGVKRRCLKFDAIPDIFPENNQPLNSTENLIKFRMRCSIDSLKKARLRIEEFECVVENLQKELSESKNSRYQDIQFDYH